jgi:hypothetical protein
MRTIAVRIRFIGLVEDTSRRLGPGKKSLYSITCDAIELSCVDRSRPRMAQDRPVEAIDEAHPDVVALMYGPLVLFAKTDEQPPLTRTQVLEARRSGGSEWVIDTDKEPLHLVPFTDVGEAAYTTYLKLS